MTRQRKCWVHQARNRYNWRDQVFPPGNQPLSGPIYLSLAMFSPHTLVSHIVANRIEPRKTGINVALQAGQIRSLHRFLTLPIS